MIGNLSAWSVLLIPVILVIFVLFNSFRILREYERGVVFMLGRLWKVKGPGLILIIPFIQQMVRVDLRTRVLDVEPQDVISRDNVSVRVSAVVYYRVVDPEKAIVQVEFSNEATSQFAQTTLRSVLGHHDLDEMLSERTKLNSDIQRILDEQTDAWGIKVANVEIKQVDINETMIRAIAKQAEAERIRRAKIIDAEGEFQAAQKLADAARFLHNGRRRCSFAHPQRTTEYCRRPGIDHRGGHAVKPARQAAEMMEQRRPRRSSLQKASTSEFALLSNRTPPSPCAAAKFLLHGRRAPGCRAFAELRHWRVRAIPQAMPSGPKRRSPPASDRPCEHARQAPRRPSRPAG